MPGEARDLRFGLHFHLIGVASYANTVRVFGTREESVPVQNQRPDTGKRTTLRLGVVSKTIAKEVGLHIDKIQSSITYQLDLPPETLDWLSRIDNELYSKFVAVGLLKERIAVQVPRLKSFLTAYCDSHYNTKTKTGQWKTRSYQPNAMRGRLGFVLLGADRKLSESRRCGGLVRWLQREVSDNPKPLREVVAWREPPRRSG